MLLIAPFPTTNYFIASIVGLLLPQYFFWVYIPGTWNTRFFLKHFFQLDDSKSLHENGSVTKDPLKTGCWGFRVHLANFTKNLISQGGFQQRPVERCHVPRAVEDLASRPAKKSGQFRFRTWENTVDPKKNTEDLHSLKLTWKKKGHPKRKRSYSKHPFSGASC